MLLILKISLRNLFRHKRKSFVVGTILFIGAMVWTLGNGVMAGRDKLFKEKFIDQFIGDITIMSNNQKDENIFPIFRIPKPNKIIDDYQNVRDVLDKQNYIDKYLPITLGAPMILSESPIPNFIVTIGTEIDEYQKMFNDDIILLEGSLLKKGERGILLNSTNRNFIFSTQNIWLLPEGGDIIEENLSQAALAVIDTLKTKSDIVVMPVNQEEFLDTRLPIKGIFKFKFLNDLRWQSLVDLESFRESFGYNTAATSQVVLSKDNEDLFTMEEDNLKDIFSDGSSVKILETRDIELNLKKNLQIAPTEERSYDMDQGAYNFVIIKLKKYISLDKAIENLNKEFTLAETDTRAVSWERTSEIIIAFSMFPRVLFAVFVNFIFFVAIIMIVNTLSMAAAERADEIGMMRAIGAQKGFIGNIFFTETILLSFIFGGAGIIAGIGIVISLAAAKITSSNEMMQLVFAGETFHPLIDGYTLITGFFQLAVVAFIAVIYPIFLARRVTPLEAINRE